MSALQAGECVLNGKAQCQHSPSGHLVAEGLSGDVQVVTVLKHSF